MTEKRWLVVAAIAAWWFFFRNPSSSTGVRGAPATAPPIPGAPNTTSPCGCDDGAPRAQQILQMAGARGFPRPTFGSDPTVSVDGAAPQSVNRDQIGANWFADFTLARAQRDSDGKFYTTPTGQL